MSSRSEGGKASWRDLPKLSFFREGSASAAKKAGANVAYNVRSAETLGAEFDNRKLALSQQPTKRKR